VLSIGTLPSSWGSTTADDIAVLCHVGLGGGSGWLLCYTHYSYDYDRGPMLALKGFGAAVLGGLGNGYGAVGGRFHTCILEALERD